MTDLGMFRKLLDESREIVGFTGAGISTEAGISDYRSQGGIWEKFTPVYLAEFIESPEKRVLYWQRKKALWDSIDSARPTKAHQFFVDLHRKGNLRGVITQNIDGLHEKSGLPAEKIVNLHGTTLEIVCLGCGAIDAAGPLMDRLDPERPPLCPSCGGLLKPNTISFGQQLVEADLIRAERLVRGCDLLIAAGSTLQVQPAASYPLLAREAGAKLAIVTLSETPLDRYADFVFNEKLGDFLTRLEG
ncbi:MAG: Sir2 family NAD-dependent protein deacetylase [Desulfofustis sp.]|jgi:NAD-dependent deacetylase